MAAPAGRKMFIQNFSAPSPLSLPPSSSFFFCTCVNMYLCAHVCVCVCMQVCVCVCICLCEHVCMCMCVCMHMFLWVCMYVYVGQKFMLAVFFNLFTLWETVSYRTWSWSVWLDQLSSELQDPPVFTSPVLGLQASSIMPDFSMDVLGMGWGSPMVHLQTSQALVKNITCCLVFWLMSNAST